MFATKTLLATLGLALALSACATHKINYTNPQTAPGGATHDATQSFFLWGLVGGDEIDLPRLCPTGVSRIQSKSGAMDGLLTVITGGLYSPMSVEVQCAGGGSATLHRDSRRRMAAAAGGGS
jgi:hypothetical protein